MQLMTTAEPTNPSVEASHQATVERVISAMRERLDRPLSLEAMAEIACLSPFHFARVFRQVTGIPPGEFRTALRLERAKQLLLTTDLSVTDVCFEIGYESLGTFTTRFTQLVGLPPSRWRRLPDDVVATFDRVPHAARAPLAPVTSDHGVTGRVIAPDVRGLIFVGLFPTAVPQRRPVTGTVLTAPGPFCLSLPPDGAYHLLVAGLPDARDPLTCLLPGPALRVGRGEGTVEVRRGRVSGQREVTLRPPSAADPPVLVALPPLLGDPTRDRLPRDRAAS